MLLFSHIVAGFIGGIAAFSLLVNFKDGYESDYIVQQDMHFKAAGKAFFVFTVCLTWILCT